MINGARSMAIGIDVGGTQARFARVENGRVAGDVWLGMTQTCRSPREFLFLVTQGLRPFNHVATANPRQVALPDHPIGLALPGLVDQQRGCLTRSVNLPFLENFPIRAELAKLTDCAVHLMTDAAAATWGEYQALPSRPPTFAHLRLGTGIALGIVRDGALVDLDTGRARHLDVLVVERGADALECRCGLCGCLETIASGRAVTEQWSACGGADGLDELRTAFGNKPIPELARLPDLITAGGVSELRAAFLRGDSLAMGIVERARHGMGQALRNIARQFGVTHGSLGGGVVQRFPELAELVFTDARAQGTMVVEGARLRDDAGVIGAARLALAQDK